MKYIFSKKSLSLSLSLSHTHTLPTAVYRYQICENETVRLSQKDRKLKTQLLRNEEMSGDRKEGRKSDEKKSMTPMVLRVMVFLMYVYVSFCGVELFVGGFEWNKAKRSVVAFSILYAVEFLWSVYPGWISMYGVNMRHMWEHHFPGMLLGLALVVHFNRADSEAPSFLDYSKEGMFDV